MLPTEQEESAFRIAWPRSLPSHPALGTQQETGAPTVLLCSDSDSWGPVQTCYLLRPLFPASAAGVVLSASPRAFVPVWMHNVEHLQGISPLPKHTMLTLETQRSLKLLILKKASRSRGCPSSSATFDTHCSLCHCLWFSRTRGL